jgi:NAD(P)-dependent dehydrogenase (short-subunit alcohol dehydrogenase family)
MKIIIVGASGKIGREIDTALSKRHDIVRVGTTSGDVQCDYTDAKSVKRMFETIGQYDALIAVAGQDSAFKPFKALTDYDYRYGFERKFLAQIRLLELGIPRIRDGGSFTFTSGYLSHYPNPASIATGPLNAAVDTFVRNTASLLPGDIRINVVSPAPVVEPGREGVGLVTAAQCAKLYVDAIEGTMSGEVLRAWGGLPIPD